MRAEAISTAMTSQKVNSGKGLPRWSEATVAVLALMLAAPVIVLAALAILLTSGLPVIFRQRRVGQHGCTFELYKFRTMRTSVGGLQITSSKDERVTRVGRFLRRTKLDELPTFWNVLRGEVSLVGPRPEVPRFVRLDDPIWQRVLAVRPGLTDPVTLRLRNEGDLLSQVATDMEQYYVNELQPAKLKGYVAYLQNRDWRSDIGVLLKTIAAIVTSPKTTELSINDVTRTAQAKE